MLGNFNKLINEKLKVSQQQLRARDERIVALETENAMLYLKLAQCEGQLDQCQYEKLYMQKVVAEEDSNKFSLQEKLFTMQNDVKELRSLFKSIKAEVNELPSILRSNLVLSKLNEQEQVLLTKLSNQNINQSADLQSKLEEAELALDAAMQKVHLERTRRKTLHNTLVELRGNIRVYCRVRPLLSILDSHGDEDTLGLPSTPSEQIIDVIDDESIVFHQKNGSSKSKPFEYERVFGKEHDQKAVFNDVAPLLTSLLDGYNVCIMAYGQTGSGKTHTMLGDHSVDSDVTFDRNTDQSKEGVIPRSAKELFRLIKESESSSENFNVEVSVFEVYNNEIRDLLATPELRNIKHTVFSASDGSQEVPSLTVKSINTAEEVMEYVRYGLLHRHEDSTNVHAHSSRSHLIVQLNIYQTKKHPPKLCSPSLTFDQCDLSSSRKFSSTSDLRKQHRSRSPSIKSPRNGKSALAIPNRRVSRSPKHSSGIARPRSPSPPSLSTPQIAIKTKLQLVDLAGSECVAMSGVTGTAFRETSNINKSLSALADVLQALADHQSHIPYRNTKLTHVLQDTIGGDSKLVVMLCVSPAKKYGVESLQCLGFGSRARQVARGPVKKRRTAYSSHLPLAISSETSLSRPSSSRR